jgi:hypothetical protein
VTTPPTTTPTAGSKATPTLQPPAATEAHHKASVEVRRFVMVLLLLVALASAGLVAFALVTGLRP